MADFGIYTYPDDMPHTGEWILGFSKQDGFFNSGVIEWSHDEPALKDGDCFVCLDEIEDMIRAYVEDENNFSKEVDAPDNK